MWDYVLPDTTMKVKVAQLCLTLCDPIDYTIHGILQAGILEWVAVPFSRGSSQPRDPTQVSCIAGRFFTSWATREAQEYWRVAYSCSSGSSRPRNLTRVSCIAGGFFSSWATREALFLLILGKIEGNNRRQDGWMASLTQWTGVWASSGRWWRTAKPDVLQSMGWQRVRHNGATEQQQQYTL